MGSKMHINHLLSELSTRAKGAVRNAWLEYREITTVEEFVDVVTKRYLMSLPNCGRKSANEIERMLRDMGYVLRAK